MELTMLLDGLIIVGGYLLGAVPFGVLIGKLFYGVDIRQQGSRNTGATNVWRLLGRTPGISTLALDILKGSVSVIAAQKFSGGQPSIAILTGLAAIVGHNWSLFLMGSGGKGVATSAGVFLALLPLETLLALGVFAVFFLITKHVSVGSIAGSTALLLASFLRDTSTAMRLLVVAAAAMILIKHVPNMKRLARGEEPKVKFK